MATGILERMKSAMSRRREDIVAKVSQKALEALEAVERVQDGLANAPEKLRELTTKASDKLSGYAHKGEEALATAGREAQARATEVQREVAPMVEVASAKMKAAVTPLRRERPRAAVGRRTTQAAVSAKRAILKEAPPPKAEAPAAEGFHVKRGQKHRHHR